MNINYKRLAKRLVLNAIKNYRDKFITEEDLLIAEDKLKVLEEIDRIAKDIKEDRVQNLQDKIEHFARLNDCDQEFEL